MDSPPGLENLGYQRVHSTGAMIKMENSNDIIPKLEEIVKNYERTLSVSILEDTPFIVEVGAFTATTDKENKVILQNSRYPTQFSKKAVEVIKTCKFFDSKNNRIAPTVYSRVQWYKRELEATKELIRVLKV